MGTSVGQSVYLAELNRCLEVLRSQGQTLERVASVIYQSFQAQGVLHVFGSGHSVMVTEELFHRAGGLAPVNPIFETHLMPHSGPRRVGPLERLKGMGEIIFKSNDFRKGEVLILISNSGINPSTVELAGLAKAAGLFTVAITSLTHSKSVPSRGDKKLYEVVDFVIDTGTPVGDACVPIEGHDLKVAPLSSAVSIVAAELLVVQVSEMFAKAGSKPPVFQSANTPGGVERNKALEEMYRKRVPLL
jgi:uncharacterized phosphosugar-binding protein